MVGIDVYCPWTEAKTVKWNERKAVTPLLTQGCTLQELYLSVLSMVRLVNALYVCLPQLYKKKKNPTSKSHLPVDFEDSHQFTCVFPRLTRYVMAYPQLTSWREAGVWQLLVNTARE